MLPHLRRAVALTIVLCSTFAAPRGAAAQSAEERCRNGTLAQNERLAACSERLRSATLSPHDHVQAYADRAFVYLTQGMQAYAEARFADAAARYDLAIDDFTAAVSLEPEDAHGYDRRAVAHQVKGLALAVDDFRPSRVENLLAIADYDAAIRLDANDARGYAGRATANDAVGRFERGIADYDSALRVEPKNVSYLVGRGVAHRLAGQDDRALADLSAALEIAPHDGGVLFARGVALYQSGSYRDAAADLAAGALPGQSDAYRSIWLHLARLRSDQADPDYGERTAKLDALQWPSPLVRLFAGAGTVGDATSAAKNATQRCDVTFFAGEWQLAQRQKAEAGRSFARAIEICPPASYFTNMARAELARSLAP